MRRLKVLVDGLPPEAQVHRQGRPWGDAEHLMAATVDAVRGLEYVLKVGLNVKRRDGAAWSPPAPVPRPGDRSKPEPRRMSSKAEQVAWFAGTVRYTPKAKTKAESN